MCVISANTTCWYCDHSTNANANTNANQWLEELKRLGTKMATWVEELCRTIRWAEQCMRTGKKLAKLHWRLGWGSLMQEGVGESHGTWREVQWEPVGLWLDRRSVRFFSQPTRPSWCLQSQLMMKLQSFSPITIVYTGDLHFTEINCHVHHSTLKCKIASSHLF